MCHRPQCLGKSIMLRIPSGEKFTTWVKTPRLRGKLSRYSPEVLPAIMQIPPSCGCAWLQENLLQQKKTMQRCYDQASKGSSTNIVRLSGTWSTRSNNIRKCMIWINQLNGQNSIQKLQNWQMTKHPVSTRCRQIYSSQWAIQILHIYLSSSTNTGKEKATSQNGKKGNLCQYQKVATSPT